MIPKPVSVRVAGRAAVLMWVVVAVTAAIAFLGRSNPAPSTFVGTLLLLSIPCAVWWVIGTLLHRYRLNRMRYR